MLGRTLAAKRCTPCRLYSTVEANPIDLSKAFNEGFSAPKPRKQPLPDTHIDHAPATRTIFVRTSQGIPSMSHAFAIIRALEEQYGTFQEFRLIRDNDYPTRYQGYLLAAFESVKSLDNVPLNGTSLSIPCPPLVRRDGGIGLEDLEGMMLPLARDPQAAIFKEAMLNAKEKGKGSERIELRIERAGKDANFGNAERVLFVPAARKAFGFRFLEWGGFAPLPLLGKSGYNEPASEDPVLELDRPNMRAALTKWSIATGLPNPSFEKPQPRPSMPTPKPSPAHSSDIAAPSEPASEPVQDTPEIPIKPVDWTQPLSRPGSSKPESFKPVSFDTPYIQDEPVVPDHTETGLVLVSESVSNPSRKAKSKPKPKVPSIHIVTGGSSNKYLPSTLKKPDHDNIELAEWEPLKTAPPTNSASLSTKREGGKSSKPEESLPPALAAARNAIIAKRQREENAAALASIAVQLGKQPINSRAEVVDMEPEHQVHTVPVRSDVETEDIPQWQAIKPEQKRRTSTASQPPKRKEEPFADRFKKLTGGFGRWF